jgi:hypothetical protein
MRGGTLPGSKRRNSPTTDEHRAQEIDRLIAEIKELPEALWLPTVLRHHVPGECAPDLTVDRNLSVDGYLNSAALNYLDQFPNADLACAQHVANCRSFAKRAGALAGAKNPETADAYWADCLLQYSPRFFQPHATPGGWLYNFPSATIELLQNLKRTGSLSGLTIAPLGEESRPAGTAEVERSGQAEPSREAGSPAKPVSRRGYKAEINEWMSRNEIGTLAEAAGKLGVSIDILKSIRSSKGKARHGADTLRAVLKKILPPNQK